MMLVNNFFWSGDFFKKKIVFCFFKELSDNFFWFFKWYTVSLPNLSRPNFSLYSFRSGRSQMSFEIGILKNFTNFTMKQQ